MILLLRNDITRSIENVTNLLLCLHHIEHLVWIIIFGGDNGGKMLFLVDQRLEDTVCEDIALLQFSCRYLRTFSLHRNCICQGHHLITVIRCRIVDRCHVSKSAVTCICSISIFSRRIFLRHKILVQQIQHTFRKLEVLAFIGRQVAVFQRIIIFSSFIILTAPLSCGLADIGCGEIRPISLIYSFILRIRQHIIHQIDSGLAYLEGLRADVGLLKMRLARGIFK